MSSKQKVLRLNCLFVRQNKAIPIYAFGIDGRLVHSIFSISYAERNKDGALHGYQRSAVSDHIKAIFDYLSSAGALLPNAIVVAFDSRTSFKPLKGVQPSEWGMFGHLELPLAQNASQVKAGWIVDGQQRATALARLDPRHSFPVVVVGFQSDDLSVQRDRPARDQVRPGCAKASSCRKGPKDYSVR